MSNLSIIRANFFSIPFLMVMGFIFFLCLVIKIYGEYLVRTRVKICYLIKPFRVVKQSSELTRQLYKMLAGIMAKENRWHRWLGIRKTISLEIEASKSGGIKYLVWVDKKDSYAINKYLTSYLPEMEISQVKTGNLKDFSVVSMGQKNHFFYPLTSYEKVEKNDPLKYLTGSLTKLKQGQKICYQLVIANLGKGKARQIKRIKSLIYQRRDLVGELNKNNGFWSLLLNILMLPLGIFIFIFSQGRQGPILLVASKSGKTSNPYQAEIEKEIKAKLDQILFSANLRLGFVNCDDRKESLVNILKSSFDNQRQKLVARGGDKLLSKFRRSLFNQRRLSCFNSMTLCLSEVVDLYHLAYSLNNQTEDMVKVYSRNLATPLSLKNSSLDVVFGKIFFEGVETQIGLSDEDRSRHVYMLGQTGSGKSTVIYHMAKDDILKDRGVTVIDPHGDLAEDLLGLIPDKRVNDLIYLNPYDLSYPIGINLLEFDEKLSGDELEREQELVCEGVISVFRRIFADDEKANAHRIEYILRNVIYTAFTIPRATIFSLYELLNNPKYRNKIIKNLDSEELEMFWKNEFGKAGSFQVVKMVSGVTAKIGRFLFSPSAKRILEQEKSSINFDDILENKKILICNLAEGKIGEDTSQLLGTMILAKIQQSAMRRQRNGTKMREPYYLFVDEFQNFATSSFTKLLSGGRKFGLRLTIAQQTTAQQADKKVTNIILANTGTVICFRTASPVDEKIMADQFKPYVSQEDIGNLPRYKFYMRLAAVEPQEPFLGMTIAMTSDDNMDKASKMIELSRRKYAIKYEVKKKKTLKKTELRYLKIKECVP